MAKGSKKKNPLEDLKKKITAVLEDRRELEIAVVLIIVAIALCGVFFPLTSKMDELSIDTKKEEERLAYTESIEKLRNVYSSYLDLVSRDADPNAWLQHILNGTRLYPVKVRSLEHKLLRKKVDRHQAMIIKLEVEGQFANTWRLIRWLETNEPFVLISRIRSARGPESLVTNLELSLFTTKKKIKKRKPVKEARTRKKGKKKKSADQHARVPRGGKTHAG